MNVKLKKKILTFFKLLKFFKYFKITNGILIFRKLLILQLKLFELYDNDEANLSLPKACGLIINQTFMLNFSLSHGIRKSRLRLC